MNTSDLIPHSPLSEERASHYVVQREWEGQTYYFVDHNEHGRVGVIVTKDDLKANKIKTEQELIAQLKLILSKSRGKWYAIINDDEAADALFS